MTADTKDRELIISRIIDAPRDLVWRAFADPQHLIHWWGPDGFTNTFHEFSFTEGGVWRFMMHGPDGTDYPNKIVFREIVEPERIVYDHSGDGEAEHSDHRFTSTVSFEDIGHKTKVTLHMVIETAAELERMKKFGAIEGGNQTLGRLDAYAQGMK